MNEKTPATQKKNYGRILSASSFLEKENMKEVAPKNTWNPFEVFTKEADPVFEKTKGPKGRVDFANTLQGFVKEICRQAEQ
jgi:hypothetical protein